MPTNSYRRQTSAGWTTNRSQRLQTELYSQQRDFDMYTIDVKSNAVERDNHPGIEVTTEMIQETDLSRGSRGSRGEESSSQRKLVVRN